MTPAGRLRGRIALARLLIARSGRLRDRARACADLREAAIGLERAVEACDGAVRALEAADGSAAPGGEPVRRHWIGVALYEKCLAIAPGERRRAGALEAARDHWEAFIWDYDGSEAGAYGYLFEGLIRAEQGEVTEALEFLRTVIGVPQCGKLDRNLVRSLLEKVVALASKLRLPGRAQAFLHAAEGYLALGERVQAMRLLGEAAELAGWIPGEDGERLRGQVARLRKRIEAERAEKGR